MDGKKLHINLYHMFVEFMAFEDELQPSYLAEDAQQETIDQDHRIKKVMILDIF